MSDRLKIHSIGVTALVNPNRAIKDGREYEALIPPPDGQEIVVARNASVDRTLQEMVKLIEATSWQAKKMAKILKGATLKISSRNIWNWLFDHYKYCEDDENQEQLRTFSKSFSQRRTRGIDCDDFTISAGSLLREMGYDNYLIAARYATKNYFQHVYSGVAGNGEKIIIDAVLDEFNKEKKPAETKIYKVMANLRGIDVKVLSGMDETQIDELAGLFGTAFEDIFTLEGIDEDKALDALYDHIVKTRNAVAENPKAIELTEDPEAFLKMLDYAIKYWHTDKRDEALRILEENEQRMNLLNGFSGTEDTEELQFFYGTGLNGEVTALGKIKAVKNFFSKVKETVQKVGEGVKKAGEKVGEAVKKIVHSVIKYNPLALAARTGLLVAMQTNAFKIAETLKWGYLTEAEARELDFDMEEWKKTRQELLNTEKVFVDVLKGDRQKFQDAILKGKAGGLSGVSLGVVVAAAAAAPAAAATPFIVKITEALKKLNIKKLLAKVSSLKLKAKAKKAEIDSAAIAKAAAKAGANATENAEGENTEDTPPAETDATENNTSVTARTDTNAPATDPPTPPAEDQNIFQKAMTWAKEHPTGAVAVVATTAGLIALGIYAYNKNKSKGMSGVGKRKKRKEPQALTGVGKKASPKKKGKAKGKGKTKKVKI